MLASFFHKPQKPGLQLKLKTKLYEAGQLRTRCRDERRTLSWLMLLRTPRMVEPRVGNARDSCLALAFAQQVACIRCQARAPGQPAATSPSSTITRPRGLFPRHAKSTSALCGSDHQKGAYDIRGTLLGSFLSRESYCLVLYIRIPDCRKRPRGALPAGRRNQPFWDVRTTCSSTVDESAVSCRLRGKVSQALQYRCCHHAIPQ